MRSHLAQWRITIAKVLQSGGGPARGCRDAELGPEATFPVQPCLRAQRERGGSVSCHWLVRAMCAQIGACARYLQTTGR